MNARDLVLELGGRWCRTYGVARCPAHRDRSPSLSVRDGDGGRLLVRCFAGCDFADVRDALAARGLWPPGDRETPRPTIRHAEPRAIEPDPDALARTAAALAIWRASQPATGSLVQVYLAARSITLPPPPSLRFHPALRHPSGATWPAMVAAVQSSDGRVVGVHRTYLRRDGAGKAEAQPNRMTLGPVAGCAVRLARAGATLAIGEGVETSLSYMQATDTPTRAALSAPGLKTVMLPPRVRDVILVADGDDAGDAAAQDAAHRFIREGRNARIARAPRGLDFNDLLRAPEAPGAAA